MEPAFLRCTFGILPFVIRSFFQIISIACFGFFFFLSSSGLRLGCGCVVKPLKLCMFRAVLFSFGLIVYGLDWVLYRSNAPDGQMVF